MGGHEQRRQIFWIPPALGAPRGGAKKNCLRFVHISPPLVSNCEIKGLTPSVCKDIGFRKLDSTPLKGGDNHYKENGNIKKGKKKETKSLKIKSFSYQEIFRG